MIVFLKGFFSALFVGTFLLAFLVGCALFCEWVIAVVSRPTLDVIALTALLLIISALHGTNKYIDSAEKAKEEKEDV